MVSDTETGTISAEEVKQTRAKLREMFLKSVNEFNGKPAKFLTYEQSTLQATFTAWNPNGSEILVTDLLTPANITMNSALLRTPDIIAITFDEPIKEDNQPTEEVNEPIKEADQPIKEVGEPTKEVGEPIARC